MNTWDDTFSFATITSTVSSQERLSGFSNTMDNVSNISDFSSQSPYARTRSLSLLSSVTRLKMQAHLSQEEPASRSLYKLTDAEVRRQVNYLELNLKRVLVENAVFLKFLERNDPDSLSLKALGHKKVSIGGVAKGMAFAKALTQQSALSLKPGPAQVTTTSKQAYKVNVNQKSDLVLKEMEDRLAEAAENKRKLHRTKADVIARLEENETTIQELETSLKKFGEFKQNYENTLAKVTRFIEEWCKTSRLMADKIRLRYSSLKVQYQKLTTILANKQLIGENLQEIDFEQLRIENIHLAEKIEKKTLLLLELKKMTAEANLKLTQNKAELQEDTSDKETMMEAIRAIEMNISRTDNEVMRTLPEVEQVKIEYERWKKKIQKYRAPDVMDYVKYKGEVEDLKKDLKVWTRRNTLKKLALSFEIETMKKVSRSKKVRTSWFE